MSAGACMNSYNKVCLATGHTSLSAAFSGQDTVLLRPSQRSRHSAVSHQQLLLLRLLPLPPPQQALGPVMKGSRGTVMLSTNCLDPVAVWHARLLIT